MIGPARRTVSKHVPDEFDGFIFTNVPRGVGPRFTDERCESCGYLIQETGECKCSQ